MIIKATLITLVVILVVVIATSYYVNKEGFDDISNNLNSALNTVTPDAASLLNNLPPASRDALRSAASQLTGVPSSATGGASTGTPLTTGGASTGTPLTTGGALMGGASTTAPSSASAPITPPALVTPPALATPPASATPCSPQATTGSLPTRTDIVPQVSFSDNGYNALMLQQKADLLKDIQKVVRNEVLANRSTTPMLHNDNYDGCEAENGHKDGCEPVKEHGCDTEDVPKNECDTKSVKDKVTAAISQGKEYENSCYKDKKSKASCPPPPDMAQFIKKDAIPCWGCNLDY